MRKSVFWLLLAGWVLSDVARADVVVEGVTPGLAGSEAGLLIGDQVTGLRVPGQSQRLPLADAFDFRRLADTHSGAPAEFEIYRQGEVSTITLPAYDWGVRVRPRIADAAWSAIGSASDADSFAGFAETAQPTIDQLSASDAAWAWMFAAHSFAGRQMWDDLDAAVSAALMAAANESVQATIYRDLAELNRVRSRQRQVDALEQGVAIRERLEPPRRVLASELIELGTARVLGEDLMRGVDELNRALGLLDEQTDTFLLARASDALGVSFAIRGEEGAARVQYEEANRLFADSGPVTNAAAMGLSHVGLLDMSAGLLVAAEDRFQRALELAVAAEPDSFYVATIYNNLGILRRRSGDLQGAEQALLRAAELHRRLEPGGLDESLALGNLGNIAARRHDYPQAIDYFERELEIMRRHFTGGRYIADALYSLALVHKDLGELERARDRIDEALAIDEEIAPNSTVHATALSLLAQIDQASGNLVGAIEGFRRAEVMAVSAEPNSLESAGIRVLIGKALLASAEPDEAREAIELALPSLRMQSPESVEHAQALNTLGKALWELEQLDAAVERLLEAVDVLEASIARLGGGADTAAEFRSVHAKIFHDAMSALVEIGDDQAAFTLSERYRAQGFLAQLAARPVLLGLGLPADLRDRRRRLFREIEEVHAGLRRTKNDAESTRDLTSRLASLHAKRADLQEAIATANPALAELQFPRASTVEEAQSALDGLVLSYVVTDQQVLAFAVGGNPSIFDVKVIPVTRDSLERSVERLRTLLALRNPSKNSLSALEDQRSEIYHQFVEPFISIISDRSHLTFVPDGPLHWLPFSVLGESTIDHRAYLIEQVSVSMVASITALRSGMSESSASGRVYAFGSPVLPGRDGISQFRGDSLGPLPFAGAEVEALGQLFGERAVVQTGSEATESSIKSLPDDVDVLHVASHAVVDQLLPLESYLVLSKDAHENGLLRAWEVMESIQLDASLVTLSACESALGRVRTGEGMIGLTRAFQYAGAESVIATLWPVADRSTSELMTSFYEHWQQGFSKAEALQKAQLALLRREPSIWQRFRTWFGGRKSESFASPRYWAGFQLYGTAG